MSGTGEILRLAALRRMREKTENRRLYRDLLPGTVPIWDSHERDPVGFVRVEICRGSGS